MDEIADAAVLVLLVGAVVLVVKLRLELRELRRGVAGLHRDVWE